MVQDAEEASPSADPIVDLIVALVADCAPGKSISPDDVARAFAAARARPSDPPNVWRRYTNPVRQQALSLARQGRIAILRKGKPVDPHAPVKGVIRLGSAAAV